MSLLQTQREFRDEIAAQDDDTAPSSLGMAIYRDAYRGRLLSALEVSFERTRTWVGEEAFTAAACHYILSHPPRGWTLDAYGGDFPEMLATLFAEDKEVPELAWLEWHVQRAFAAPDQPELTAENLAAAGYRDEEWEHLCFGLAPGFAMRAISTDCATLWETLANPTQSGSVIPLNGNAHLIVWRRGLSPHYRIAGADEAQLLRALAEGQSFGVLAAQAEPDALGAALAGWLSDGLLSGVTLLTAFGSSSAETR